MRIAVVSDIHGNRTAFEAVLADLRQTSPDLVLHGGDLADSGSSPVEIIDCIRDLGWPGVVGNTDEMLFRPDSLAEFAAPLPHLRALFASVGEMADFTRTALGPERLSWLAGLPRRQLYDTLALVHAGPESAWRSPVHTANDGELESTYCALALPVVVYGHIHRPHVRHLTGLTIANAGSAGQPHDGDRRASYLLVDDAVPTIRRVEYDVDCELRALAAAHLPHADWIARIITSANPS